MNTITIKSCKIENNQITILYEVEGILQKYINYNIPFIIEYSESIQKVPQNIAIIPFIADILPLIWLTDGELYIDELDESFYNSIDNFKQGYITMYPMLKFKGKIYVKKKIKNKVKETNNVAAFFSGGVDAFATLIAHLDEKPLLITLWGADINLNDTEGWKYTKQRIQSIANSFNLNNVFVRTNFRSILNEKQIPNLIKNTKDNWWHGFQHGIGIISHAAPLAYTHQLSNIYFASSFTIKDKGKVTCASDSTIDNFIKMCNSKVTHDQYEYSRQEKVKHICDFVKENNITFPIHVCWITSGGKNCCHCEKCYRTMFALFAEGVDPKNYGFNYTEEDLKKSYHLLKYYMSFRYKPIQKRFQENKDALINEHIKWICTCDIDDMSKPTLNKKIYFIYQKICIKIKRILNK